MKRRGTIALIVVVALLLVAALALRWAMRPEAVGPRVLDLAGQALGLEITADEFDYRLRGSPQVVARGVAAREPGATGPLFTAERVLVSVPWSTVRARGADPVITRIELDAPRARLAPLLGWWSQRPRGDGPLPTLREGLRVDRGHIDGDGWSLREIAIDLPHFAPDARLGARVRGRWLADALQVPFDLQLAMTRPAADAGVGIAGTATPRSEGWRLPTRLSLSTRLAAGPAPTRLQRLRLSADSRYASGDTVQPFALGLAAEGRFAEGALRLEPAALALRGRDMIPQLLGRGHFGFDDALEFGLAGELAQWPDAWPALPPPIGESDAPLPFQLRYRGSANLADPVELQLARSDARFDGRLRAAEVAAWIGETGDGSPLPPLDGRLRAPRVDISGASLHGVEVIIQDAPDEAGERP